MRDSSPSRSNSPALPMQLLHFGAATAIMRGARFIGAEEAPVGNPANNGFDPKAFLAKVGAGKAILKFEKISTSSGKET
jgi:hypothetical protein